MRLRHKTFSVLGSLVTVFVLGACTSNLLVSDNAGAEVSTSDFLSPLDEFIGHAVWNNQDEFQRAADEFTTRREELIAQCMREAGFNYHPDLNSTNFTIGTTAFDDVHPDDRDWVAQFGFGIVSGHRHRSGGSIFDVRDDDPNAAYVASLSAQAREAFEFALHGPPQNVPTQLDTQSDWEDWMRSRGCMGQAIVQAQSENPLFLRQADEWASLFTAIDQLGQAMLERPEIVELNREWSHCMADAGHSGISSPRDASSLLIPEYFETSFMVQQQQAEGDVTDATEPLAALQSLEIDLALTDLDCRLATNYTARVNTVRHEVETQFIADNRALLEEFRNATE